jgi:hypothetical protein
MTSCVFCPAATHGTVWGPRARSTRISVKCSSHDCSEAGDGSAWLPCRRSMIGTPLKGATPRSCLIEPQTRRSSTSTLEAALRGNRRCRRANPALDSRQAVGSTGSRAGSPRSREIVAMPTTHSDSEARAIDYHRSTGRVDRETPLSKVVRCNGSLPVQG